MGQIRRFRKKKIEASQKINKLKSTLLKLSLIMLNFIVATFAWFTYTKILNPIVDVNVSAWQIDFKDDTTTFENDMTFSLGTFYPGMKNQTKSIEIVNLGDRAASISYNLKSLYLLGNEYQVLDAPAEGEEGVETGGTEATEETGGTDATEETGSTEATEGGEATEGTEGTSDFIVYKSESYDSTTGLHTVKLLNDSTKYPFEIILTYSATIDRADSNNNKGKFEVCFTWPYDVIVEEGETPNEDEVNAKTALDTQWGYDIANFYEKQEEGDTTQGIEIVLQAIASQII